MPERDGRDLSLVFLIDALGKEIVGRDGFLDALVPRNRPRVRSILGYSSAAIPTLFTGVPPAVHGHWAMYRRDRGDSVFRPYARRLRLASKLPAGKWRTRRWLTAQLRRDGLTGYFSLYEVPLGLLPFFDLSERRNIYRPGAFDGVRSLFDRLVEESVPYRVWDWSVPEERSFSEMEAAAREGNERFLMLYSSGLDGVMHVHGPDSPAARAWLKQAEGRIGAVVDAARRAGRRPRLRVFGDHGMAPVRRAIDLSAHLAHLPVRIPRDALLFLDSTMARFWFSSEQARRTVVDSLSSLAGGRFVSHEELASLGAGFPDREYGEEIFLADPGVLFAPSFMGLGRVAGMHGYHPDDPDSDSTLLADPMPEEPPETILEIAPLLLRDLGLPFEAPR